MFGSSCTKKDTLEALCLPTSVFGVKGFRSSVSMPELFAALKVYDDASLEMELETRKKNCTLELGS